MILTTSVRTFGKMLYQIGDGLCARTVVRPQGGDLAGMQMLRQFRQNISGA
jgi:hypothetical protein